MKKPIIIITGPTAVGKTSLSVRLAKQIGGEIISADSMQVYRHMDIGSAKITAKEMEGVPHHLIDILEPTEEFNVVTFQKLARKALLEIDSRGAVPIIAGGTGFYIQALLYDIDFTKTEEDSAFRREMEQLAKEKGAAYLHAMLAKADPESAGAIHENNIKRVIRALEYHRQTGKKISAHNETERRKQSPYRFLYYVVNTDRNLLYERIDRRVDQMMDQGLLKEVKKLRSMGLTEEMVSMQGLGYKELLAYLDGRCGLKEAVYVLKRDTRHFAKRQLTWFKRERDVRWLNLPDFDNDVEKIVSHIISQYCQEMEEWSQP